MLKKHCKYIKNIFFWIFVVFTIFGFSENFINKKVGQKLGNNRCPLFTILTKQNSSMFCIVSFVKNKKRKWSHYLGRPVHILTLVYFHDGRPAHTYSKWSLFRGDRPTHSHWSTFTTGDLPTHTQSGLFSGATGPHTHTGLLSRATCPFDWVYLRSHLAI